MIEPTPHRFFLAAALAMMAIGSWGVALPQQVPPSVSPGIQERRLEQPPMPRAVPPIVVPETPLQGPPPGADEIKVTLTGVSLSGNTAFSEAELAPLWERYLGREVTLAELWAIPAAITVHYRNAGYVLSRALIPPQEITSGIRVSDVFRALKKNVPTGRIGGAVSLMRTGLQNAPSQRPQAAS
jgi:hemolysin activation/secretion protein